MDDFGCELAGGGAGCAYGNYFYSRLDIGSFCPAGIFGFGCELYCPFLVFDVGESQGGCGSFGNRAKNGVAFVGGGLGDYQNSFGGEAPLGIGIAHNQNEVSDLKIGRGTVFAALELDQSVGGYGYVFGGLGEGR